MLNPTPLLNSLFPSEVDAGGTAFTLLLTGADFVNDSVVRVNGVDRATTYLSATQLETTISASDIAAPGILSISVFNPAPGGGGSTALLLTVNDPNATGNPQPILTSTSPVSATTGSGSLAITIYGAGFTPSSVVRWDGAALATTFVDSGTLQAVVSAANLSANGIVAVTVNNPAPGGGNTAPQSFFVLQAGEDLFYDNFNRPDNADIGNNWVEKTEEDFFLVNGALTSITTDGYHDSIVYRPAAEALLNLETGVEFTRLPDANRFPQLHARIDLASVDLRTTLGDYLFFYNDFADRDNVGPQAIFAIQAPVYQEYECYIAALPLPEYFVDGERYRLRFRVTGTDPVVLTGYVEQFNGASWDLLATGSVTHDTTTQIDPNLYCDPDQMPAPITIPGTVGFAKWINPSDNYDNFYRIALVNDSIPPVVNGLQPGSAEVGDADFTLTVQGQFFTPDSVILWNGSPRTTTYLSTNSLTTTVTTAEIQVAGNIPVSVTTPGVGTSSVTTFSVSDPSINPLPVATGLGPSSAYVGNPDLVLTVNGNNFTVDSIVRWNGADRVTTFVSTSNLQITVAAAEMATAGAASITVFTPAPGGGTSQPLIFTVLDAPTADFFDDFNRPNGPVIGNGWIEKTPAAFQLNNGFAQKLSVSTSFQNNVVYRPAAEDALNVETSIEFSLSGPSPGYPQIFVRAQSGTITGNNAFDAYLLFINNGGQAVLRRQNGTSYTNFLTFTIGSLNTSSTYRLRLSASGTNPVALTAYVEQRTGSIWTVLNQVTYNDGSVGRIDVSGTVGFSGYIESGYQFDNFTRTLLLN